MADQRRIELVAKKVRDLGDKEIWDLLVDVSTLIGKLKSVGVHKLECMNSAEGIIERTVLAAKDEFDTPECLKGYDVNKEGVIVSPGKFEGEPRYVPYFWDEWLSGGSDDDEENVIYFDIGEQDWLLFPELKRVKRIGISEGSTGFVGKVYTEYIGKDKS